MLLLTTAAAVVLFTATVATASTATTTTSATTCYLIKGITNLFVCGFTAFNNCANEVKTLACQWVIEVNGYLLLTYFGNESVEACSIRTSQRNHCPFVDEARIKFAVYFEDVTRH